MSMNASMKLSLVGIALVQAAGCAVPLPGPAPDTVVAEPPRVMVSSNANYVETIKGTAVRFEMVWIEEGQFWIGKTEVTWDEYLPYCDFGESGTILPGADAVSKPSKPLDVAPYDRNWGTGKRPAVGMSKNAAQKYCEWLSINTGNTYRLPTEAEWRLAAGEQSSYAPIDEHAWHAGNTNRRTEETGRKKPNGHGLHDVLGNLWEYCLDPYSEQQPKRAVLRGGSWKERGERLRVDERLGFEIDWILDDPNVPPGVWWVPGGGHLGFRVLRETPGSVEPSPTERTP